MHKGDDIMRKIIISLITGIACIILLILTAVLVVGNGKPQKPYKVGISNGYVGNNWRNQMFEDLYETISLYKEHGYIEEVIIKNAGTDLNNQIEQIKHLIQSNVDLLLIDPNTYDGLDEVIKEAFDAGILVVVFDQNVSSQYAVQLTIDQKNWGRKLAQWMVNELGSDGSIVIMEGVKNQPCNDERLEGIMEVINAYPKIQVIGGAYGNWDQATAKMAMTDLIATLPSIDGIIAQDGMALGIMQAFESAEAPLPIMTGETMVAFMGQSFELSITDDFKTYALTNPPGIGASALSMGLALLMGDNEIEIGRRYYYPVTAYEINKDTHHISKKLEELPGTYYLDDWMTIDEIIENILLRVNKDET